MGFRPPGNHGLLTVLRRPEAMASRESRRVVPPVKPAVALRRMLRSVVDVDGATVTRQPSAAEISLATQNEQTRSVVNEIDARGGRVEYRAEGRGMAPFQGEDPHVCRLVVGWQR